MIDIEDHGATPDQADNGPAINDAMAAAMETSSELFVPARTYPVVTPVEVPSATNLHIRGAGHNSVIASRLITAAPALTIGGDGPSPGVSLSDFRMTGQHGGDGVAETALIMLNFCLDGRVSNLLLEDSAGDGLIASRPQNVVVSACRFRGCGGWGVRTAAHRDKNGQQCRFVDCTFHHNGRAGAAVSGNLALLGGGEHVVRGCQIEVADTTPDSIGLLLSSLRHHVSECSFEQCHVPIQFGTDEVMSGRSTVDRCNIVGGRVRFVNYQSERVMNCTLEDRASGKDLEQWSVEFDRSPSSPASPTRWVNNLERPLGPANGRVTRAAPAGAIEYESFSVDQNSTVPALTIDSATPSVLGSTVFVEANTQPTVVTGLVDAHSGKLVTIVGTSGNTTIVADDMITLNGGASLTLGPTDTITLVTVDGVRWCEVSRSSSGSAPAGARAPDAKRRRARALKRRRDAT